MRQQITVEGSGKFPIDMLRCDRAWPASKQESDKIDMDWATSECPHRQVILLTDAPFAPTRGRWIASTWRVVRVTQT